MNIHVLRWQISVFKNGGLYYPPSTRPRPVWALCGVWLGVCVVVACGGCWWVYYDPEGLPLGVCYLIKSETNRPRPVSRYGMTIPVIITYWNGCSCII